MQALKPSNIWLQPYQHGSLSTWLEFVVLRYGLTPDILSRSGIASLSVLPNPPYVRISDGHSKSVSEITHYCVIHSNSTAKAELLSRESLLCITKIPAQHPRLHETCNIRSSKDKQTNKQNKTKQTLHTHTQPPKQTNTKTTKPKTKQQLQNQY